MSRWVEFRVLLDGGAVFYARSDALCRRYIEAQVSAGDDRARYGIQMRWVQAGEWGPLLVPDVPRTSEQVRVVWARDPDSGPREVDQES